MELPPAERQRLELEVDYRRQRKSPWLAASLSMLAPGAGQLYLGRPVAAAAAVAAPTVGFGFGLALQVEDILQAGALDLEPDDSFQLGGLPTVLYAAGQAAYFYNVYDAYRAARRRNAAVREGLGLEPRAGRLPLPDESLFEHLIAPIDPRVIVQPEVLAGTLGLLGAVITFSLAAEWALTGEAPHLFEGSIFDVRQVQVLGRRFAPVEGALVAQSLNSAISLSAGVGEEALFRGVIQHQLSEWLGRWWGWLLTSAAFGAVHAPNALLLPPGVQQLRYLLVSLPVVTAVGAILGLISMENDHALREVIAVHFWYDFALLGWSVAYSPLDHPFSAQIGFRF